MTEAPRLLLASQSPARRKLLAAAGIDVEIMHSGVDEEAVTASNAEALCLVLARMKAEAVADKLRASERASENLLILGCDSVFDFDGQPYGKPDDVEDATLRWQRMRGREGVLRTGHCLIDLGSGKSIEGTAATGVTFADVSDEEIAAYIASGEPLQVAGAFTIDGLASSFVTRLAGDHTNVVGLSMPTLRNLLAGLGVAITDLWRINTLT